MEQGPSKAKPVYPAKKKQHVSPGGWAGSLTGILSVLALHSNPENAVVIGTVAPFVTTFFHETLNMFLSKKSRD